MNNESKIYVAGHRGLVGSAIVRRLRDLGFRNLLTRTHAELDLTRQAPVEAFFETQRPEYVFVAAAKVGGIHANSTLPADFIYINLAIQNHLIHSAWRFGVRKLLFLGSSCIYPRQCPQPMKEEHLLAGYLEPTNEPYAVAKIAGIKMCQAYNRQHGTRFICAMPTNLYGPQDNFDLAASHVLPALIRKFHTGRERGLPEVEIWGTGTPRREFLHVNDLADACVFLMRNYQDSEIINVGTGSDLTIGELAEHIARVVGYRGGLSFDPTQPDGTPVKRLDVSRLSALGWRAGIDLDTGLRETYRWYIENEVED